jgi:hypothetical protein
VVLRRTWAVSAVAFVVATLLVVAGSVATFGSGDFSIAGPSPSPPSHSSEPSCVLSVNCGGGGALGGGCVVVPATDCSATGVVEPPVLGGRVTPAEIGHLPAGVAMVLLRPPQGSLV